MDNFTSNLDGLDLRRLQMPKLVRIWFSGGSSNKAE